jgi:hypothetical protein
MDGQNIYNENGTPILRKEEYIFWSIRMESHLKALGHDVWNSVITDYFPPNRVRTPAQKKSKKINSMAMNTILDGLPDDIKEKIGECNSAKELWEKLKDLYSDEKSNEAFQSEQSSVYNNSSDEDSFEEYSDIEAEVNMEAELESSLDELRKYKQRCKQLKDQLKTVEKLKKGTEALNKVLSLQRSPSNKYGLGYDHAHIIKGSSPITQIEIEDDMSSDDTSKESAHPPKKMYQIKREDSTINKGKDSPQSSDCNNVDIELSPASREEDSNTITECSVSIYPMEEEEEKLSKAKEKVDWSLSEYLYHHNESDYSYLHDYTQEFLEKSQKHVLEIKEMLKDSKKIIYEQDNQLEEKEEEIKRLKNEISQAKEEKKEDDVSSKNLADLKELRENYVNLKIQLEEAKRREEVVRNQLDKKEESCHKMEAEVVNLRKKVEKLDTQIKFLNNSMTLDEILDSRRSPYDKTGLGHNKEEISNLKKPDASPSFVKSEDRSDASLSFIKRESKYDAGSSCSKNKRNTTKLRRSDQGRHQATQKERHSWMNQRSYSYTSKQVQKRDTFMDESKKV